jgi:hypothetical protein
MVQTYSFVDDFHEDAVQSCSVVKSEHETNYGFWTSECNVQATISTYNTLHDKYMNLLYIPFQHFG